MWPKAQLIEDDKHPTVSKLETVLKGQEFVLHFTCRHGVFEGEAVERCLGSSPHVVKWGHVFCQNLSLWLLPAPSKQVDGSTAWLLCCKRFCSVDTCGVRPTSPKQLIWRFEVNLDNWFFLLESFVFLQKFLLNIPACIDSMWFTGATCKAIVFAVSWAMGTGESCQHIDLSCGMFADCADERRLSGFIQ